MYKTLFICIFEAAAEAVDSAVAQRRRKATATGVQVVQTFLAAASVLILEKYDTMDIMASTQIKKALIDQVEN